ncbi:hypothetical protein ABIE18_000148 [Arthrobacter sp. 2762]
MIAAEIFLAAAQGSPQPDYMPAVIGFVGTLFGATIGLAFNSFSHREQKRRHLNEKTVELLRHTDAIRLAYMDVYRYARRNGGDDNTNETIAAVRKKMNEPSLAKAKPEYVEARIVLDYIRLTADSKTYWLAREVAESSNVLLAAINGYTEKARPVSRRYTQSYGDARNALIAHLSPTPPAPRGPRVLARAFSRWAARHLRSS